MNNLEIVNNLKEGKIGIVPTDTVYGIIADAFNEKAVDRVFKAKKRNYTKPFLILVSNKEMLQNVVKQIRENEIEIMNRFWPGPLTILFEKNENISDLVTSGSNYVAVRLPNNKFICDIIDKLGNPIVAPSANISSKPSAHKIEELEVELRKKVDFIVDGGTLNGCESTLIKIEENSIEVLREGAIKKEKLKNSK